MNDVNQRCVSLASGTLNPDLRVNYEFGLVLGVNEFRQEQLYFLEKDYLYNRELHGYGVASGLHVTATDDSHEVLITVEPGMALDQWGRPVVVRDAQCARLGAWLAKQKPEDIRAHRDPQSGKMSIYVVANHDECLDELVPIAGQPCSTSESLQAPSRIRDFHNIELRWQAPAMPAWDAVRCFARLMSQVRIHPDLPPDLSDEQTIIERVRNLDQPCFFELADTSSPGSPPDTATQLFHLPAATAREALDRIFTIWVTEVRPKLRPNLLDPKTSSKENEAAILLSRIDFEYDDPSVTNPRILSFKQADDTGRPYLLHTQLIQELLTLGSEKPMREFATLQVQNEHTLYAWVHHQDPLDIPPDISVDWNQMLVLRSDGIHLTITDVTPEQTGVTGTVLKIATVGSMDPGKRIELKFLLQACWVQGDGLLQERIAALDFDYVGHDRDAKSITVYTIATSQRLSQPGREFATLRVQHSNSLLVWEHHPDRIHIPTIGAFVDWNQLLELKSEGKPLHISKVTRGHILGVDNALEILTSDEIAPEARVELTFKAAQLTVESGVKLQASIDDLKAEYVGHDLEAKEITAYTIADGIPATRDFVTINTVVMSRDGALHLTLWFHDQQVDLVPLILQPQGKAVVVQLAKGVSGPHLSRELPITLRSDDGQFSSFWNLAPEDGTTLDDQDLLSFSFDTDLIRVGPDSARSRPLTEIIREKRLAFVGYDGDHMIRVFYEINIPELRQVKPQPFVTITPLALTWDEVTLEVWFHPNRRSNPLMGGRPDNDVTLAISLEKPQFSVFAEVDEINTTQPINFRNEPTLPNVQKIQRNVYHVWLNTADLKTQSHGIGRFFLRFVFLLDIDVVPDVGDRQPLREYIKQNNINIEGYFESEDGKNAIVAYTRIAVTES